MPEATAIHEHPSAPPHTQMLNLGLLALSAAPAYEQSLRHTNHIQ